MYMIFTHNIVLPSLGHFHTSSVLRNTFSYLCNYSNNLAPYGAQSQRSQVVARAGLLSQELSHVSLSRVPGHQAGQETFRTGGYALTLADHVLRSGPGGPRGLAPGEPHRTLQELRGTVVQRGRDLQIQTVEEGGAGHGLWGKRREGDGRRGWSFHKPKVYI